MSDASMPLALAGFILEGHTHSIGGLAERWGRYCRGKAASTQLPPCTKESNGWLILPWPWKRSPEIVAGYQDMLLTVERLQDGHVIHLVTIIHGPKVSFNSSLQHP